MLNSHISLHLKEMPEEFLIEAQQLHKDQLIERKADKLHKNNLSRKLTEMKTLLCVDDHPILFEEQTNTHMLRILNSILNFLLLFHMLTGAISFRHHLYLCREPYNFETFIGYFSYALPISNKWHKQQITNYIVIHGNRYYKRLIYNATASFLGLYTGHQLVTHIASSFSKNETLCALDNYLGIRNTPLEAMPDSHFSMILVTINCFLWMTCLLLLVEKQRLKNWISTTRSDYIKKIDTKNMIFVLQEYLKQRVDGEFLVFIAKAISLGDSNIIPNITTSVENVLKKKSYSDQESVTLMKLIKDHKKPTSINYTRMIFAPLLLISGLVGANSLIQVKARLHHVVLFSWEILKALFILILVIRAIIR